MDGKTFIVAYMVVPSLIMMYGSMEKMYISGSTFFTIITKQVNKRFFFCLPVEVVPEVAIDWLFMCACIWGGVYVS